MPAKHIIQLVGKRVKDNRLLRIKNVQDWLVIVHQSFAGVVLVADLEYLELGIVNEL